MSTQLQYVRVITVCARAVISHADQTGCTAMCVIILGMSMYKVAAATAAAES